MPANVRPADTADKRDGSLGHTGRVSESLAKCRECPHRPVMALTDTCLRALSIDVGARITTRLGAATKATRDPGSPTISAAMRALGNGTPITLRDRPGLGTDASSLSR